MLLLANQLEELVSPFIISLLQAVMFLKQMGLPMALFLCSEYLMIQLAMLTKGVVKEKVSTCSFKLISNFFIHIYIYMYIINSIPVMYLSVK